MTFLQHCVLEGCLALTPDRETTVGQADALTLLLVEAGSCHLPDGEGGALLAMAGDLLVVPKPVILTPTGPCMLSGCRLSGRAPMEYAGNLAGQAQLLPRGYCGGAQLLLAQLADGEGQMPPALSSALAYSLLCQAALAMQQQNSLPPLVEEALAQIRDHYAEVYGVEELADTLMVTKSHLIRSFTAAVGLSPGRYLTLVRVENAKRLLLQRDYTLEVVASLCGFSGANYLCRVFRRATGQTPAAWRRQSASGYRPATPLEEQVYL